MNRIFKKVWNRTRRCMVAVNESSHTGGGYCSSVLIGSALTALAISPTVFAGDYIVNAGETKELNGDNGVGYTTRWQDLHNYGTLTVRAGNYIALQEGKGGHFWNEAGGVMYVYGSASAAGISNGPRDTVGTTTPVLRFLPRPGLC